MSSTFINHIAGLLQANILRYSPIAGGDISPAYLLKTTIGNFFIKINTSPFDQEAKGLQAIADTHTIHTPTVVKVGQFDNQFFLILNHIPTKSPTAKDFEKLGHQLSQLHQVSANHFGWQHDNFIGSLPQSNTFHDSWATFYTQERLLPQLLLAKQNHLLAALEVPSEEKIFQTCQDYFKNIKPALLHGDLWSGNFLIGEDGTPYLIDPATYYGHAEVDIAMSKLFGGFHPAFYDTYFEILPRTSGFQQRIDLYQLYYLLVHLNIFGRSYYASVISLLKKYF